MIAYPAIPIWWKWLNRINPNTWMLYGERESPQGGAASYFCCVGVLVTAWLGVYLYHCLPPWVILHLTLLHLPSSSSSPPRPSGLVIDQLGGRTDVMVSGLQVITAWGGGGG